MTMLAWWGRSALGASEWVEASLPAWRVIVCDVGRCMVEVLNALPAGKRLREDDSGTSGGSTKRRYVV